MKIYKLNIFNNHLYYINYTKNFLFDITILTMIIVIDNIDLLHILMLN